MEPSLNDLDLVVAPGDAEMSRLLQWLEADSFSIESWNGRVTPLGSTTAFADRYYFRARRSDARGSALQVDVNVAENRAAFDACVVHEEPRKPSRGLLAPSHAGDSLQRFVLSLLSSRSHAFGSTASRSAGGVK